MWHFNRIYMPFLPMMSVSFLEEILYPACKQRGQQISLYNKTNKHLFVSLVAGNVSAIPGTATPPGQPQPSPSSQQGQFLFTGPVPQMPGQPQAAGPGPAGPTQFTQAPLMYISNANVPTSTASGPVSYITGKLSDIFFSLLNKILQRRVLQVSRDKASL